MSNIQKKSSVNVTNMVLYAMFTAIIFIMAFTPFGLIDLPIIKATILHIPVIIGSIVLGLRAGIYFGALFGLTSLIKNTIAPSLLSFAFSPFIAVPGTGHGSGWAILICFLPRILVGVTPWLLYYGIKRLAPNMNVAGKTGLLAGAGVLGSLTNTFLVMGLIYLLFKDAYATISNVPVAEVGALILGVIAANGIPEAIAAGIITPVLSTALLKAMKKY